MNLFGSITTAVLYIVITEFSKVAQIADCAVEFKKCYNTSEETHCFDVQDGDTTNQRLYTSFDKARIVCKDLNSTLVIIKNEEIGGLIQGFMSDTSNPIKQRYIWLGAHQVNDFNNTYTWHWLNSTLPNLAASSVSDIQDYGWYTAVLEYRYNNGKFQYYLTAKQPQISFYYVCEYSVSNCSSPRSSAVRLINGRCYVAMKEMVSWYEARNRCLKRGGDLASFANVTSIDFTPWLGSDSNVRYWIGLRFSWYAWDDSEQDMKYTNWATNAGSWSSPCLILCSSCDPIFTWSSTGGTMNGIYVVCHTVKSLKLATTSTTVTDSTTNPLSTLPTATSNLTEKTSTRKEEGTTSSIIPLAVGVGVGVGVPVIIGIVLTVIYVVRKHRLKTPTQPSSTQTRSETFIDEGPAHRNGSDENNHYAFVPSSLSSKPTAAEENVKYEAQYAALGFPKIDNLKTEKDYSTANIL